MAAYQTESKLTETFVRKLTPKFYILIQLLPWMIVKVMQTGIKL